MVDMSSERQRRRAEAAHDPLLALFFLAWRGFAAEPDALLARVGLGRVHHRVLYTVVRLPGVRVGDLAAALGITRQALHRPLSELTRKKLVSVTVAKSNRRERALHATERGVELEDRASGLQRAQLARAFEAAGADAAQRWALVMEKLAEPVVARVPLASPLIEAALRDAGS